LRSHKVTLSPLFGLALLALAGYYGSHLGLTMRGILPIVLVLAALLLLLSFVGADAFQNSTKTATDAKSAKDTERNTRSLRFKISLLPPSEALPLLLIMGATWLLSIAPVLGYGALLPIGHNWDVEFYLPLADYLKDYSYPTLAQAPANPLRDLLLTERLASRAMGATYAQALADLLVLRDAWDTWVPMLATLRALSLAGLYAFLRVGLGVRVGGALAGVALAGASSLLLWTTYNSFGMGLGGLALLGGALVCTLLLLEEGGTRTLAAAVLLLGGLTATYWPMLMAYGAAGLGIGLALLVQQRHSGGWIRVAGRGLLLLVGGALVSLPVHLRASDAFLGVFAQQVASMGVLDFISPAVIAGSAPFSHLGLPPPTRLPYALEWAGLAAAVLLLAVGVWRGTLRRGIALGLVLCLGAYLLGIRSIVQFPYGYLRGASYVNILLLGLVGAGAFPFPGNRSPPRRDDVPPTSPPPTGGRDWEGAGGETNHELDDRMLVAIPAVLLLVVLAVSNVSAITRTYEVYAQQPGVVSLESARMRGAIASVEQPGVALISPAPEIRGPSMGALAYALRGREMFGVTATGYRLFAHTPPGSTPALGVLHSREDPREYGLADLVWQGERGTLYRAPPERVAWRSGRPTLYTEGALLAEDTTGSRAQLGTGSYLEADPTMPLDIPLPAPDEGDGNGTPPVITLALSNFSPQTVEVDTGDTVYTQAVPAGTSHYRIALQQSPPRILLRGRSGPLWLRWWSLEQPAATTQHPDPTLTPFSDTLLLQVDSAPTGSSVETTLTIANPPREKVRLALEIYEDIAGYHVAPAHYAWSLFPAPPAGTHTLTIDLQSPSLTLNGEPQDVQTDVLHDGRYFAALWVYQGEQVRRVLPFVRFERRAGVVTNITPLDLNVAFVRLAEPAQILDIGIGDGITLHGYTLRGANGTDPTHLQPGDRVRVSLLWQTRQVQEDFAMVFVQLLDTENRKVAEWNGAAGGEWCPTTAWQPDQRIWQDIPLTIAPDAPAGSYRLVAGLFNVKTGERLTVEDGSNMLHLETIEIGNGSAVGEGAK